MNAGRLLAPQCDSDAASVVALFLFFLSVAVALLENLFLGALMVAALLVLFGGKGAPLKIDGAQEEASGYAQV